MITYGKEQTYAIDAYKCTVMFVRQTFPTTREAKLGMDPAFPRLYHKLSLYISGVNPGLESGVQIWGKVWGKVWGQM
jgi:hypothetical protein